MDALVLEYLRPFLLPQQLQIAQECEEAAVVRQEFLNSLQFRLLALRFLPTSLISLALQHFLLIPLIIKLAWPKWIIFLFIKFVLIVLFRPRWVTIELKLTFIKLVGVVHVRELQKLELGEEEHAKEGRFPHR